MRDSNRSEKFLYIGAITIVTVGLYLSSLYSYILFHSLIEIVTIAIAFALFILTWNTGQYMTSSYLRLLGISYAFIALIDLVHTLAYKGMGVFPTYGSNLPTQLWIAARYLQAVTLLAAPFLVERRTDNRALIGIYAVAVATLVALIVSGNFPVCYIEGAGLTPFKITSEYVISALLLVAFYLFYRKRAYFNRRVFWLISASIGLTTLSEISFTAYVSVYGFANLVGHFAKLAAFYLIYQAILVTGLKAPFDLIFQDIKRAEEALRKSQDTLEEKVKERTSELRASEAALHRLNRELEAISDCNQALMRAVDEQALLNDICQIICAKAGYRMAWVGYPENDEAKTIHIITVAGAEQGYLEQAQLTWADTDRGRGPAGLAIRTGQSAYIQDFASDPHAAPWRENALQRGYRSSIALPLKDDSQRTFGLLSIYSTEPHAFTPDETRLLEELAGDLAFGILVLRDRTERQRAEEALRESAHKLKEAQRMAQIGYWDRNFEAKRITLSDEACRIFGLPPQVQPVDLETWHNQWLALIHPDDRAKTAQAFAAALQSGFQYDVEYRIVRPDGEVRFVHSHAELTRDATGQLRLILGMMQDVTERKRVEEALQAQYSTLRGIIDSTNALIFSIDRQYHYTSFNQGHAAVMRALYGVEIEKGHCLLDYMTVAADRETTQHNLDRALAGEQFIEEAYSGEELRLRQYFQVSHNPIHAETGEIIGVAVLSQDLTARRRAEEALLESERKYRLIFDNVLDGIYLLEVLEDGRFRTLDVNPALERMTGIPRALSVGKTQEATVSAEVAALVNAKYRHCIEASQPIEEEVELDLPSGQRYFHSALIPTRDKTGQVRHIIGISRDVTAHKQAEAEVQKLNRELEERVVERTAQLEAANKELEAFAYSVSHDLRAPLRHIDGFLEMLEHHLGANLDEQSRHYMTTISTAAKRMGALIDDLLAFSRMGRHELSKLPVKLNVLIQEVLQELEPEIQGRKINWQINPLPTVTGDRAMLRSVLVNLISNAVKFTRPCPNPTIEIGGERGSAAETIVYVRDNGVGFDPQYADKLFGVFQRLHRAEEFEGTGIGLANVRRIIARHGGRTWAKGEVDRGATFFFSLPKLISGG